MVQVAWSAVAWTPSATRLFAGVDNQEDPLQAALQRGQERVLDNFIENGAPKWMRQQDLLPFECTECGRCCRTQGSVVMDEEEVQSAAELLGMGVEEFKDAYASHRLDGWIRLKDDNDACVFLDQDTNHCQIYEARPLQCRTYPFWPSVVLSERAWNSECRRADDETNSTLPPWTPEEGGCEGMRPISEGSDSGVPLKEACRQLMDFGLYNRRFPHDDKLPA